MVTYVSGIGAASGGLLSVGLAISLVGVGYGVTDVRYPGSGSPSTGASVGEEAAPDHIDPLSGGNSAHPADARIRTITIPKENDLYTLITVEELCKWIFMLLPFSFPVNSIHQADIQPQENVGDTSAMVHRINLISPPIAPTRDDSHHDPLPKVAFMRVTSRLSLMSSSARLSVGSWRSAPGSEMME
jgi:hypothetical protein